MVVSVFNIYLSKGNFPYLTLIEVGKPSLPNLKIEGRLTWQVNDVYTLIHWLIMIINHDILVMLILFLPYNNFSDTSVS